MRVRILLPLPEERPARPGGSFFSSVSEFEPSHDFQSARSAPAGAEGSNPSPAAKSMGPVLLDRPHAFLIAKNAALRTSPAFSCLSDKKDAPFSLCSCKEKVEKRESTPGEGISHTSPPRDPSLYNDQRGGLGSTLRYSKNRSRLRCAPVFRPLRKLRPPFFRHRRREAAVPLLWKHPRGAPLGGGIKRGEPRTVPLFVAERGESREGNDTKHSPPLCPSLSVRFLLDKQEKADAGTERHSASQRQRRPKK